MCVVVHEWTLPMLAYAASTTWLRHLPARSDAIVLVVWTIDDVGVYMAGVRPLDLYAHLPWVLGTNCTLFAGPIPLFVAL